MSAAPWLPTAAAEPKPNQRAAKATKATAVGPVRSNPTPAHSSKFLTLSRYAGRGQGEGSVYRATSGNITFLSSAPTSPPTSPDLFCISCGYNQHGIVSDRCPECGQSYAALPPSPVRLPWTHRRHLGLLRAYWRTAGQVIFHHEEFCHQIDTPIPLRDARLFWLFSILQAFLPILAAAILLFFYPPNHNSSQMLHSLYEPYQSIYVPIPIVIFFLLGLALFFAASTGLPSYFCHPRALPIERQNRAIALSYFASAPIGLMPIIIALLLAARPFSDFIPITMTLKFLAALLTVFMFGAWYIRTIRIVLTLSQRRRKTLTVLLLTTCWVALATICILVVPISLWYTTMLIHSLF